VKLWGIDDWRLTRMVITARRN